MSEVIEVATPEEFTFTGVGPIGEICVDSGLIHIGDPSHTLFTPGRAMNKMGYGKNREEYVNKFLEQGRYIQEHGGWGMSVSPEAFNGVYQVLGTFENGSLVSVTIDLRPVFQE